MLPSTAKKIEISSVTLKQASPKKEYEIGDRFDYSGLSVSVKYNDGTEKVEYYKIKTGKYAITTMDIYKQVE